MQARERVLGDRHAVEGQREKRAVVPYLRAMRREPMVSSSSVLSAPLWLIPHLAFNLRPSADTTSPMNPLRLAWANLVHKRTRTLLAAAGVAFAVVLVFMELGMLGGVGRTATMLYDNLQF